jgi:hypothetical protein
MNISEVFYSAYISYLVVVVAVVVVVVVVVAVAVKMVKILHFQKKKKADLVCWQAPDMYQYIIHIGNLTVHSTGWPRSHRTLRQFGGKCVGARETAHGTNHVPSDGCVPGTV